MENVETTVYHNQEGKVIFHKSMDLLISSILNNSNNNNMIMLVDGIFEIICPMFFVFSSRYDCYNSLFVVSLTCIIAEIL